jgi:hypothetical protein
LLQSAGGATNHVPAGLADLDRFQSINARGYAAVKSGADVVLWGVLLQGERQAGKDEVVVAYQKAVPSDGGHVLLSAGIVKKMTASEFNFAPMAAKH